VSRSPGKATHRYHEVSGRGLIDQEEPRSAEVAFHVSHFKRLTGEGGITVKAIRYYRYGPPDVLALQDVDVPAVGARDVLVRAASVNPLDWHFMRGTPYVVRAAAGLSRPKAKGLGADMAGQVEAVGKDVTEFRPGDEVFGSRSGTFAEYVSMPEDGVVLAKPANRGWHPGSSSRATPR